MRVLHWYPNFLHGGGCANAVLGLAAAESRQGAHVMVAAAALSHRPLYEPTDSVAGVDVVAWHPTRTLKIAAQYVRLAPPRESARLSALEPDVVHVHGEFNLDNLRVSGLFRCPVVISPHGACHPVVLAKSRRAAKRIYLAAESALLRNHARVFHALSPAEADHLATICPRIARYCVPQGPSVVIPESTPGRATTRTGEELTVRFVFVGRLDIFTKGLDILLDAFGMVARRSGGTRTHLILAGPDWKGGRPWLEHRATQLGIKQQIEFTGPLTGSQVRAVLDAADIYVQLSRHEGFPLSVAEALLASKPAVLSNAIGTLSYPEIAALSHVRIVSPSREEAAIAMTKAAEDLPAITRAARCCKNALTEFFSWDRIARLHLDQYMRLLRA